MTTMPDSNDLEMDPAEETEDQERDLTGFEILSYPSDMTLKVYADKWDAGHLLIPAFEREYVWDQTRASKLIESFLLGLPVPEVFLYKERAAQKFQVIDGQQRILSAIRFFQGRFENRSFELRKVDSRWEGKTFQQLLEREQLQLYDSVLRAVVVQQLAPDDHTSVYHVFERLNTGSVKLSPMEIRKCVYHGDFFVLLEELNRNTAWREILGRKDRDKRLRDIELILRFFAMRHGWEKYEKPMNAFLNNFMSEKQSLPKDDLDNARGLFERTCDDVVRQLGQKPFHLRGNTLNPGLLDAVMVMMSFAKDEGIADGKERFRALLADPTFHESVRTRSTSDTVTLKQRFRVAHEIMVARR